MGSRRLALVDLLARLRHSGIVAILDLLSLKRLDLDLAWRRTLWWSRRRMSLVAFPDRLPYEVIARLNPEGPDLRRSHEPAPPLLIMSTKRTGAARPIHRVAPIDLLLYQATVDALGE